MKFLRKIFGRKESPRHDPPGLGGDIAANGLADWWQAELTIPERETLLEATKETGFSTWSLTTGSPPPHPNGPGYILTALATCLRVGDAPLIFKMLRKAETFPPTTLDAETRYFLLHNKIEGYYRCIKTVPQAKVCCVAACREQIQLSPMVVPGLTEPGDPPLIPSGYDRLSMIYQRDRNVIECAKICEEAIAIGGGPIFQTRLDRCRKAAEKN